MRCIRRGKERVDRTVVIVCHYSYRKSLILRHFSDYSSQKFKFVKKYVSRNEETKGTLGYAPLAECSQLVQMPSRVQSCK